MEESAASVVHTIISKRTHLSQAITMTGGYREMRQVRHLHKIFVIYHHAEESHTAFWTAR